MVNLKVMKRWANKQSGFTIVELLIVIVVIAILAAITIVAYNGIRERTQQSQVQSVLSQANKKILAYAAENADVYPDSLQTTGFTNSGDVYVEYAVDNTTTPRRYALTAANGAAGQFRYFITSAQPQVQQGTAPGHNLVPWDKSKDDTAPVAPAAGITIDTSVFRNATASMRVGPSAVGKELRGNPYTGVTGQTVTVKLWIRTDSNWNGGGGNSKIRFGRTSDGNLLTACSYNGVKTTWTEFSCSYNFSTGTNGSVNITVGNDGSTGNIWLDDISVGIQ